MSERDNLYMVKAMYLGSEPMGELLEGENGSDAIQVPLKRTILRTENIGEEVELSMTNDALLVTLVHSKQKRLVLPIDLLAYCGALRQLPANQIKGREFETLDKSPHTNPNDPPLFVTIFRNFEQENTLFCHSFIIRHDEEAMELVKLVMEIYYNLIRLQELDETSLQDQDENYSSKSGSSKQSDSIRSKLEALNIQNSADKAKKDACLLDIYNKLPVSNAAGSTSNGSSSSIPQSLGSREEPNQDYVCNSFQPKGVEHLVEQSSKPGEESGNYSNAEEIYTINKLGENNFEIVMGNGEATTGDDASSHFNSNHSNTNNQLVSAAAAAASGTKIGSKSAGVDDQLIASSLHAVNNDPNPIVIRKKNEENIEYKQNVFIRWLQPPTPPPPAPIIIREVQEEAPEEPPLIIYKQAPRPETPPPLVIRERPPSPLDQPTEPFIIEKRIPYKPQQRKVIVEHLPAPPAKPRDIILEKWLPSPVPSERTVFYQRLNSIAAQQQQSHSQYDLSDSNSMSRASIHRNNSHMTKQIGDSSQYRSSPKTYNKHQQQQAYTSHGDLSDMANHFNNREIYYPASNASTLTRKNQKVAGYRITRQIIPGPNATAAEIEKALARSTHVSTTMMNNSHIYSPVNTSQIYSGSQINLASGVYHVPLNGAGGYKQQLSYHHHDQPIYNMQKGRSQQQSIGNGSSVYMNQNKNYMSQHDIYVNKKDLGK